MCGVAGLEELEPSAVYRSMLEQLQAYDPKDAKARAMSIRLFLHLPVQLSDFSDPTQSPLSNHLRNRVILSAKVVNVTCSFRCQIWSLEIYTLLEIFGRLFYSYQGADKVIVESWQLVTAIHDDEDDGLIICDSL